LYSKDNLENRYVAFDIWSLFDYDTDFVLFA